MEMNKTEMTEKLAKKCDLPKAKAAEVITALFDTDPGKGIIAVELDAGRKVAIAGFGTFDTKHRSKRTGRNPATGETIELAAKTYPTFKAGKGLKDRVAK
jgi:DNA-binding protein HU-beta